jgi:glycosyltransferase involved in cell wall biosynthesis
VILNHQAGWAVTEFSTFIQRLLYTPLEYLAGLCSTRIICVSHAVARQARPLQIAPLRKLVTICNGIDPGPFLMATQDSHVQAIREELGIPHGQILIGNTGRLAPQKDNGTLVRALVSLKSWLPDLSFALLIIGDGPDRSRLECLVQSLGLNSHVYFLGFRKDIVELLAALDVFVSPSLWEGLSISILEAMAAARPIITTSILANAELIEHEVTGLLVPPGDPELLARAIARFIREPDLAQRCAMTARKRVLEYYTIDRMFQETWDLYINLLNEKQPGRATR